MPAHFFPDCICHECEDQRNSLSKFVLKNIRPPAKKNNNGVKVIRKPPSDSDTSESDATEYSDSDVDMDD